MSTLYDALRAALPAEAVTDDAQTCAAHAVQGVVPRCVAAPGSAAELAAALRVASAERAAVIPWGGGTQQHIGYTPERADLVVRTARLSRVLIHEPDDLTISVEAGMTLGALRAHLARHGQMLPIDPPLPDRATLGGLIATMMDGPRRLGYGTLRDLLIGIGVVEASGDGSKAGGMVVKNVSGFDMMKLYGGSYGTLAVIASANFKLLPAPRQAASVRCTFASAEAAFAFLAALHATQLTPTAAEFLTTKNTAEFFTTKSTKSTKEEQEDYLIESAPFTVVLRAEGLAEAVARHTRDIAALAQRHAATSVAHIADDAALWARIADRAQTAQLGADEAVIKVSVLPSETQRVVALLDAHAERSGQRLAISARALSGVLYARLAPTSAADLHALAATLPGVQWLASALPDAPRWGTPPPGLALMRRFKAEFDPQALLNPGRFVEHI